MLSLIFFLALGWLLYKALFPKVAPYYGKTLPPEALSKHRKHSQAGERTQNRVDGGPKVCNRKPRHYEDYDHMPPIPNLAYDPADLMYWGMGFDPILDQVYEMDNIGNDP